MSIIIDAIRTPIGKINKSLAGISAADLGAVVVKALIEKNGLAETDINEVVFCNCTNRNYGNIARVVALKSGLPETVPAVCVDRRCSSSLNAIAYASMLIDTGNADIVIAGGTESSTHEPFIIDSFTGEKANIVESPIEIGNPTMIQTAENIALEFNINRDSCDEYAYGSQLKAIDYYNNQLQKKEIIPIKNKEILIDKDDCIRFDTSLEKIKSLNPVLPNGVVTAGNCTPKNDGASAVLVASEEVAQRMGKKGFRIEGFASAGCNPNLMGIGPVFSTRKLMDKTNKTINDYDIIELNEAFAVQVLACKELLNIKDDKLNVFGGAIAFGHPYAASGGILVARAINALTYYDKKTALITFCCGGGQGFSMSIAKDA